ncbi:MFS transporter [Edaphobacter dinghuensis]|uniref:Hexuronate transporter n=1 Tax=Edaphobacter dinghuensis TaxID=1560005 RepID=A0A917GZZ4_9BACT|nr:MFS transporter [Edaphobacter dinghuensis]GGG63244.1 hexuronate transporter [Edaphobacter dinghuensis]
MVPLATSEKQHDGVIHTGGKRRWFVLGLLFAITVINFIDRQTVSVLAPVLREVLHLTNEQYGRVVAAFQFGMMTGELPMGALMDRWGVRLGLMGAVLWWSGATGMQSLTRTGTQLGLTRFWMGTGECGNYSGGMKVVARLFTKKERTLAIGIFNSGSMIGATVATPLIVYLMQRFGFRAAFLLSASLGLLWVPLWWFIYREPTRVEQKIATTELAHNPPSPNVPLRDLIANRSLWAVMLCRFFIGPVIQFYWYWIPSYLFSVRHLTMTQLGFLGWIPFLLGDFGGFAGGWAAGWLQKQGASIYRVRQLTMYSSSILCIASLLVPHTASIVIAFLLIGVAMFADNFLSANMFGSMTDLFQERELGRVTGFSGVASGLSGLIFPLLTGVLVDRFSYAPVFFLVALMPLLGTIALFIFAHQDYRQDKTRSLNNL